MSDTPPRILYCHCQYAQVVPKEVKDAVLRQLCESGVAFEAVADLCEMTARRDPALPRLAAEGAVKIAACFPRAVKGLFHQAKADLAADRTEVLNMRVQTAEDVCARLFAPDLAPNLPTGKETMRILPPGTPGSVDGTPVSADGAAAPENGPEEAKTGAAA